MNYRRFEWLTLGAGAIVVIGAMLGTLGMNPVPQEVIGQLLVLGVLVGAVHWGRNGGFIAALGAVSLYMLLRVPTLISDGLTADVRTIMLVRVATYGAVGILGGELCARIKYFFAGLENRDTIDPVTQVYTERYMAELLAAHLSSHEKNGDALSVVLVDVAPALLASLRPARQRALLRGVANILRNDVRLVDEVGHLSDGRFLVVLPRTPRAGGLVVLERACAHVRQFLAVKDECVNAEVVGTPDDNGALYELLAALRGDTDRFVEMPQASSS